MENIFTTLPSSLPSPPLQCRGGAHSYPHTNTFTYLRLRSSLKSPHRPPTSSTILYQAGCLQHSGTRASKEPATPWHTLQLSDTKSQDYHTPRAPKQNQLLILDLNGILIRAYPRYQELNVVEEPAMYMKYKKIYFRPELPLFIDLCLESFEVAIWSCFALSNIKYILRRSIGRTRMDKLLFIWDQKKCTFDGYMADVNGEKKPKFLKNIWKVTDDYPEYGPENILMVDDDEYKLKNNPCYKYICPESYDPEDNEEDQSSILLWKTINNHFYNICTDDHVFKL